MITASLDKTMENRTEERNHPQVFVEIKSLTSSNAEKFDALTADVSDSGVALYTYRTLRIGDKVELSIMGVPSAIGEISNINQCPDNGLVRIGVRFLDKKDKWPL